MNYTRNQIDERMQEVKRRWMEEWIATDKKPSWDYEAEQDQIFSEWLQQLRVGDHAHICHYSDITPCTVIRRTKTMIVVRNDKAERSEKWDPQWVTGGFAGHCINNDDQRDWWICEEDPNGSTETFRWHRKIGRWVNSSDEKLYPEWRKHYDYNF